MNMREKVTFKAVTLSDDGYGGKTEAITDIATVWARVQPVRGREVPDSGRLEAKETYLVGIRYRTDLITSMRLVWKGKELNILSIQNRDERRQYLTIECETE